MAIAVVVAAAAVSLFHAHRIEPVKRHEGPAPHTRFTRTLLTPGIMNAAGSRRE